MSKLSACHGLLYGLIIGCLAGNLSAQVRTPAAYWEGLTPGEKTAFVNGVYTAVSRMKIHHTREVMNQYGHDPYWREPYFIERFHEILDEHFARDVGYNLDVIVKALDALYSNYDNSQIPVIESLRIVSTSQNGDQNRANALLIKAQREYRP